MFPNVRNLNLWIVFIGDILLVTTAYYCAYLIRFEGAVAPLWMHAFQSTVIWIVPVYLAAFNSFKLYNGMWRYTSVADSLKLFNAVILASCITIAIVFMLYRFNGFSRSIFIINGLLIFLLVGGFRVSIRYLLSHKFLLSFLIRSEKHRHKNLIIIGAGSTGEKLIRELGENKDLKYRLLGLIDDNPAKHNLTLHGIPVLGPLSSLTELVHKYEVEEIAIAIPSASMQQMRRIIDACKKTGATYKTFPGLGDIIQGKVTFSELRDVRYEDLLKRDPIKLDNDSICGYLTGKCVVVTGGAGSIGSELCRQIAAFSPKKLIILERNESGLYELVLDIKALFPEIDVIPVLAAIQNQARMMLVFSQHRPQVVFHAAAYKHVPMMEHHPWEAIFNNVVGSRIVLQQCRRFGVRRCVMVSTDKAVRPTNVMGATKRLVELLTQKHAVASCHTRFMAVRFGNVLGSVGSVLPLFKKQIAAGGPVTVTDPRMTRFFMTIPEACSLILQAGAYGRGGEIYVLKMGTPICIDDMARDLISLSGLRPGEDIEICYTGLRPGEKLYEELITHDEGIQKTRHEDIMVLSAENPNTGQDLDGHIDTLIELARQGDAEMIKNKLHDIIPEYHPWKAGNRFISSTLSARSVSLNTDNCTEKIPSQSLKSGFSHVPFQDRLMLQLLSMGKKDCGEIPFETLPIPYWEKIIQSALKHQIAPLLYLQLKRAGVYGNLPLEIGEQLRKIYLYFVKITMRQHYWLGKLLQLLVQHELPVLIVNGPHLGENIYRNITAKPMAYINLCLSADGMRRKRLIRKQIDQYTRRSGVNIYIRADIRYPCLNQEIHTQRIWQRAHSAEVSGCTVMVPCPEDLLLCLCMKFVCFYRYRFSGIQTLCDVCEILHRYSMDMDWDIVGNESRKLAMTNAVGLTLTLAKDLLNAPISEETMLMFGSKDQLSFVGGFALQHIFDEDLFFKTLPPQFLELWESKYLFNKALALRKLFYAVSSTAARGHVYTNNTRRFLRDYKNQVTCTLENYAQTATILLTKDQQSMKELRKHQQNALIWEWIYGNRQSSEKIFSVP